MGGAKIQDRVKELEEKGSTFGASLMAGAKYDSHIVENLDADFSDDDDPDDYAGYAGLSAYWQHKFNRRLGLRADYNLYADFHEEFKENDVLDQLVSVEPQWYQGDFIFSLPLRYVYSREDDASSYHRYTVAPTVTWKFPERRQAIEFYAMLSQLEDVDEYPTFDEDGHSLGGGLSYLISLRERTYFRLLTDYQRVEYDARAWDYLNEVSDDQRQDILTSLGAEFNYQLTARLDFLVRYTFVHTHSNVAIYDYDQHIVQAGVSVNF